MKTSQWEAAPARYDAVIVGSGVAGLRAAIEAAEGGLSVALLAKDSAHDSSTDVAQGGVAVAISDEDQVGLHYADTLAAGDGLCDEAAVQVLVGEGPRYINQLIEWGAQFDREGTRLAFTREAAHSASRVLHAHGDSTGREMLRALWRKASALERILFLPHTYSVDLVVLDGACSGLKLLDGTTGQARLLETSAVLLATGGLGQIYRETTNPPQATGDGMAIAWRAGALLRDMEFVQFHPTSLHVAGAPRFLLSEALRGEGGILRAADGRRFMSEVDPRGELAPRDVVARAIFHEMRRSGSDHVLLDMTRLDGSYLRRRFPRITATCERHGVDLAKDPVPVAPAAHYMMGGVVTDLWGATTVRGLYAAGEVACTGVHGGNRLASNSLLEGLVFGARAGRAVLDASRRSGRRQRRRGGDDLGLASKPAPAGSPRAEELIELVKDIAWKQLGIVREASGLQEAIARLEPIVAARSTSPISSLSRSSLEAGNMAAAALLIARCGLARQESRGAHFRADFPERDDRRFGGSSSLAIGMKEPTFSTGAAGGTQARRG